MEPKKSKILASISLTLLFVLSLVVLYLCIGVSKTFFLVASLDSALVALALAWAFFGARAAADVFSRRASLERRRTVSEGERLRSEYSFLRKVAGLPARFGYEELEVATDGFRAVIGRGSSASVFKGLLEDGTPVAVKRIEGSEYAEREFRSEVAAIAAVQHVNLARLLGYCLQPRGGYRKNFDRFFFFFYVHVAVRIMFLLLPLLYLRSCRGLSALIRCLPWALRRRVAIDVARALAYLHHDCRSRVLHLDVKPENILLDEDFRARVTDFGLSKLMSRDASRIVTTVRGTRGYLAPEWLLDSGISEKSDVYSFGMVLLEIVGGRRNVRVVGNDSQRRWSYFPRIVSEKVREGRLMEVADERLMAAAEVVEEEVRALVHVALWCIQEKAKMRPSMACVVDMLEGRAQVEPPPETEMIIVDLLSIDDDREASSEGGGGVGREEFGGPFSSTYSYAMSAVSGR
ncbi:putative receptor-like protein kinase [Acorus calamus]|uniref:Receptor-like protein kinase n=1 Tax=Acorus calamus TaxID=4465 RepID=A0AAV9DB61_ACOCL|nr:putative receptor-like protein kinase [Acorus calamus]